MGDLLCHAATFARIAERLKRFGESVSPVTIDDSGSFSRPWGGSVDANGPLSVVYGTQDIYFSKASSVFFQRIVGAPRVDWFQSSAAGTEHPMIQAVGRKAERFTSSHEQSPAIAEWVLWAGFEHFQGGPARRAAQADQRWTRLPFREISDTRWLIVGFGHIGRETARRLRLLGAHVTGLRRTPGPDSDADEIIAPDRLAGALPQADAVLMCAPLTPQTERMADAAFFAAMQPGALFANVGRGRLVDEAALLAGLDADKPGAAYLDVVETEPLPQGHAIWHHPQVMLTPHISALTDSAKRRTDALFLANLEAFLSGAPMRNPVDKSAFVAR